MKKRAISPAIATIFLIGVAVVGAIAAGNGMFKQNEITQKTTKLDLIDVNLVKIASDKTYFAATVKNTGMTTFSSVNVSFVDEFGNFYTITSLTPLEPGEQFGDHLIENVAVNLGKKYLINIDGTTPSGSTFRSADTINVRG
ncbi:MAG TPA: hypothetical protein VGA92_06450 [Candidatus Nitrosotenuis sp.]